MNTIILAAGNSDFKNKVDGYSSSQLLSIVNGRPIISWVIGDSLKKNAQKVVVVIDAFDEDLKKFCYQRYARNNRVEIKTISHSRSIVESLFQAVTSCSLDNSSAVTVLLGDTLVLGCKTNEEEDAIYISHFEGDSGPWCVTELTSSGVVEKFHNKVSNLSSDNYWALVGKYVFQDFKLLQKSAKLSHDSGKRELSTILEAYSSERKLKGIQIDYGQWIDFGHLEGISHAKTLLMESRAFNSLRIDKFLPLITKSSSNEHKLLQELYWYDNVPGNLKSLTPRIFSNQRVDNQYQIMMEFYGYGTLTEKFLFLDLSLNFWERVLNKMFNIVETFKNHEVIEDQIDIKKMYHSKTFERVDLLLSQDSFWSGMLSKEEWIINGKSYKGFDALRPFIDESSDLLSKNAKSSVIHGDLCFNNILYDVSSGVVKFIDPRGEFGKGFSIYGDPRYDIAKLRHSFCGNYDHIVEGLFHITMEGKDQCEFSVYDEKSTEKEKIFNDICEKFGYAISEICFIEALLFISMIPLHNDSLEKQKAFFFQGLIKLNQCLTKRY